MIVASFFDNLTNRHLPTSMRFSCDQTTMHIKRGTKKCFNGPKINKRSKKKEIKSKMLL